MDAGRVGLSTPYVYRNYFAATRYSTQFRDNYNARARAMYFWGEYTACPKYFETKGQHEGTGAREKFEAFYSEQGATKLPRKGKERKFRKNRRS